MKRPKPVDPYQHSIFLDSGAFGLFNVHVRKAHLHGGVSGIMKTKQYPPRIRRDGRDDFSFYKLTPGSEFRKYCDKYAKWLKHVLSLGIEDFLYVNVDVITHPDLTWDVQQYLEKEHGLNPVPVIHANTEEKYIARYLESGRYDLIGLGGLGQNISMRVYRNWADRVFTMLCPASNKNLPIVRVHGFAMTSWEFICRWPWWSVDSATWVKLAAYGWLYISKLTDGAFDYSCPPYQINVSFRSPFLKKTARHRDTIGSEEIKQLITKWIKYCGLLEGSVEQKIMPLEDVMPACAHRVRKNTVAAPLTAIGGEPDEFGIQTHFGARAQANLHYLKDLEESRPKWPYPFVLEERGRKGKWTANFPAEKGTVGYLKGFGLH